jgi:flagellin-like hook-associated protein FlgL
MNISKVGQQLDDIETKISTQKNINAPSDDPIKYAASIRYDAELSLGTQYNNNLQRLSTLVGMYDTSFSNIGSQLSETMQMANTFGTMDADMRMTAGEEIKAVIENLVTIGNTKLGNSYIYGGKQADEAPFRLNNDYSVTYTVSQQGEDATNIYVDKGQTGQYGISGRAAFYDTVKIAFGGVANKYTGDTYSNTDSFAYVLNGTNNGMMLNGKALTLAQGIYNGGSLSDEIENQLNKLYVINLTNNVIYVNGSAVPLTSGTYTGAELATEIGTQLGASYAVSYESVGERTFSITNNTGAAVTFNWSDPRSTVGRVLGFDDVDSIVSNLGTDTSDHGAEKRISVAFDSTTRKLVITNDTGGAVIFNNASATAAGTLGFNNIDNTVASGETIKSDFDTGRKGFLVKIASDGPATGALASRATYQYSIDGGVTWSAGLAVNTGGADTTADITITTGVNDTFWVGTNEVVLTGGTSYTGTDLATEIQTQLNTAVGSGHLVSYDAATRKFTITNNTGAVETFNWSNPLSTAAGVLGFDNTDSVVSSGANDVSDYDAGMFIDGAGVVNATNNRIKLLFSTTGNNLDKNYDTFQVKDLSVFELLKNLKDAFESDNTTWVDKNCKYIEKARKLTTRNNSIIAFQGTQAKTIIDNNKTKENKIQAIQADLVNADMSELAVQFNTLLNTYQALLSTLARMQSINILNYLK